MVSRFERVISQHAAHIHLIPSASRIPFIIQPFGLTGARKPSSPLSQFPVALATSPPMDGLKNAGRACGEGGVDQRDFSE